MNKFLSFLILLSLTFVMSLGTTAYAFTEVEDSDNYYDAIDYLNTENIVNGYDDWSFKPENKINRVEFLKIVVEAFYGDKELSTDDCDAEFSDVDISLWYGPYLCFAVDKDIIDGYPDNTFKPDDKINFVEASKIIVIASKLYYNNNFSPYYLKNYENGKELFNEDYANWYEPFVETLEYEKSVPSAITSFNYQITRGDMAEIIYRLKNGITDKENSYLLTSNIDNKVSAMEELLIREDILDYEDSPHKWRIIKVIPNDDDSLEVVVFGEDELIGKRSYPIGIFILDDDQLADGFHVELVIDNDGYVYKNLVTPVDEDEDLGVVTTFSNINWLNSNEISYDGWGIVDCYGGEEGEDCAYEGMNSYKISAYEQ